MIFIENKKDSNTLNYCIALWIYSTLYVDYSLPHKDLILARRNKDDALLDVISKCLYDICVKPELIKDELIMIEIKKANPNKLYRVSIFHDYEEDSYQMSIRTRDIDNSNYDRLYYITNIIMNYLKPYFVDKDYYNKELSENYPYVRVSNCLNLKYKNLF